MHCTNRQRNETVRINDDITIVVLDIQKDRVRLGVQAPRNHTVFRGELYEQIYGLKPNKDAATEAIATEGISS